MTSKQPLTYAAMEEQEWIKQVKEGSERAFALIVAHHSPSLYAFLKRMVGNGEDAEDLAQETFWQVYKHRASLKTDVSLRPFLFTIARRKAISLLRWRKVRRFVSPLGLKPEEWLADEEEPIGERLDARERERAVERLLQRLDLEKRSVLILRFFEGMKYKEISKVMNKPEGTVKNLAFRAERELREKLKRMGF